MTNQPPDTALRGWRATLDMQFRQTPRRTVLASQRHTGPLMIQRPFYPEGETCHVYLLHPPGGIVGGDELDIQLTLEAGARALVTMPGATKFYRSAGGKALLKQQLTLQPGSCLEWLPQDAIFFPGARASIHSRFQLADDCRLIAWDVICLGRPTLNEPFSEGLCENRLEVWHNDQPLLIEQLVLDGANRNSIAEQAYIATLLIWPGDDALLERLRDALEPGMAFAGATLTDGLLVFRYLGNDNLECQRIMQTLWSLVRETVTGLAPQPPRIWST